MEDETKRYLSQINENMTAQLAAFRAEVNRRFDDVDRRFDEGDTRFEELEQTNTDLKELLVDGDPHANHPGLLERMRILEQLKKWLCAAMATIGTVVAGLLLTKIWEVVTHTPAPPLP